jgi:hypothetical protein
MLVIEKMELGKGNVCNNDGDGQEPFSAMQLRPFLCYEGSALQAFDTTIDCFRWVVFIELG